MKKIIYLTLLVLIYACSSTSKLVEYQVKEKPKDYDALIAVGDFYDDEAKISYTILKDDDFVYVYISSSELASQLKILENGVVVYIDKNGKQNQNNYIQYPLSATENSKIQFRDFKENKSEYLVQKLASFKNEFLMVTDGKQEHINHVLNPKNVSVELESNGEQLLYQLKIPRSLIVPSSNTPISLGIEIAGVDTSELKKARDEYTNARENGNSRGSGNMGTGRGGGGRGGTGYGGKSPSNSGSSSHRGDSQKINEINDLISTLSSDTELWFSLNLDQ